MIICIQKDINIILIYNKIRNTFKFVCTEINLSVNKYKHPKSHGPYTQDGGHWMFH